MEAHEHAPLKDRLTPAQLNRRRQKMHRRGIGRIDLERNYQQLMQATVAGFQAQGQTIENASTAVAKRGDRNLYIVAGVAAVWLVILTGRFFGWW